MALLHLCIISSLSIIIHGSARSASLRASQLQNPPLGLSTSDVPAPAPAPLVHGLSPNPAPVASLPAQNLGQAALPASMLRSIAANAVQQQVQALTNAAEQARRVALEEMHAEVRKALTSETLVFHNLISDNATLQRSLEDFTQEVQSQLQAHEKNFIEQARQNIASEIANFSTGVKTTNAAAHGELETFGKQAKTIKDKALTASSQADALAASARVIVQHLPMAEAHTAVTMSTEALTTALLLQSQAEDAARFDRQVGSLSAQTLAKVAQATHTANGAITMAQEAVTIAGDNARAIIDIKHATDMVAHDAADSTMAVENAVELER